MTVVLVISFNSWQESKYFSKCQILSSYLFKFVVEYCFTHCTFVFLWTWLFIITNDCVFSTGDILLGCRCGCGRGFGYEPGCGCCWGWGYARVRGWGPGCGLTPGCGCCGADCGNSLAGVPGGTTGMAVGSNPWGTGLCRNAENHTAAHSSSHWDISDGIKEMSGKHKVEMLEEDIRAVL